MSADTEKKATKAEVAEATKTTTTVEKSTSLKITNMSRSAQVLIDSKGNGVYLSVGGSVQLDSPVSKDMRRAERLGYVQITKN